MKTVLRLSPILLVIILLFSCTPLNNNPEVYPATLTINSQWGETSFASDITVSGQIYYYGFPSDRSDGKFLVQWTPETVLKIKQESANLVSKIRAVNSGIDRILGGRDFTGGPEFTFVDPENKEDSLPTNEVFITNINPVVFSKTINLKFSGKFTGKTTDDGTYAGFQEFGDGYHQLTYISPLKSKLWFEISADWINNLVNNTIADASTAINLPGPECAHIVTVDSSNGQAAYEYIKTKYLIGTNRTVITFEFNEDDPHGQSVLTRKMENAIQTIACEKGVPVLIIVSAYKYDKTQFVGSFSNYDKTTGGLGGLMMFPAAAFVGGITSESANQGEIVSSVQSLYRGEIYIVPAE